MSIYANAGSPRPSRPKIAAAYLCDRNYHDITLYSLASFARSHSSPLDFHFFQVGYHKDVPARFKDFLASHNHTIRVLEAPFVRPAVEIRERPGKHRHITGTALLKECAIGKLSDAYDYVLYLDGDMLAFSDVHCEHAAGFNQIAAVCLDLSIGTGLYDPSIFDRCSAFGLCPRYFNSGLMLINSRKWRETEADRRFAENLERHLDQCPYMRACPTHDQCVFNMTFNFDSLLLPVSLNVQKCALHTHAWRTATVRHYTGYRKFLPVRARTCDPREYALLRAISRETGLPGPGLLYDHGISYLANKVRRRKEIAKYEIALAQQSNAEADAREFYSGTAPRESHR
ncbi:MULTISPECIES: glycosyltransferase [unclassified Mesorhizobium]|uniref:glycosyltransferase family 8 protein n=1 Tax=unclassified Mesorhizobium TaxID=325217 RepID=UPI000BAF488E|nr:MULTISPECIES: glycosyltransferase [unclassified Mesorhizobium]TGT54405.1 hypothetical protein EN813_043300 [Mesorhizobium sp. M00.F.Ca.ET.170.01.1.1]PBB84944.1 hypothetical protein CK216_20575 [Mesorhizobium sp. WSM3876]RWE27272.1 MAG: hypothetical protein EOS41_03495 [Mesorhizobium sp.]TGS65827.1 hypothetical protein EN844_16630 [Mesorhizobium sp. M3A.F.Ca.ET.201.01.1.1]TGS82676.1 hypothetical protein EN818_26305 [Mesorhizobium sp. M3A.F.Ca.ET.175.01.1.1]